MTDKEISDILFIQHQVFMERACKVYCIACAFNEFCEDKQTCRNYLRFTKALEKQVRNLKK